MSAQDSFHVMNETKESRSALDAQLKSEEPTYEETVSKLSKFKPCSETADQQPKIIPGIVALDIDALLSRNFPPMETMLTPWLCKQHLSMVHAWRGVGKTHFSLGVA